MDSVESGLRRVFINREGELRSGWRVVAFVVCVYILSRLIGGMVYLIGIFLPPVRNFIQPGPGEQPFHALLRFGLESAISLASAVLATHICASRLEYRTCGSVGLMLHHGWSRLFIAGSVIGSAALGLAIAAESAIGSAGFSPQPGGPGKLLSSFIGLLIVFVMAAAFEELIFR